MFNSDVLEVGVGLTLFFLLASLMATAIRELVEALLKTRAMDLERGIRELLDDPRGTAMARSFFDHAQIFSLFPGSYDPGQLRSAGLLGRWLPKSLPLVKDKTGFEMSWPARRSLPNYIPAGQFATALIDLVGRGSGSWPYPVNPEPLTLELLRQRAASLPSPRLQRAILSAIDHAGGDLAKMKTNLEDWFNGSMDRVSGAYKRRTQAWLLAIGLAIAVAFNLDAITVAGRLVNDPVLREAAAAQAQKLIDARPPSGAVAPGTAPPAAGSADRAEEASPSNPTSAARKITETSGSLEGLKSDMIKIGYPIGWLHLVTPPGERFPPMPIPAPQGCKTVGEGDRCEEALPGSGYSLGLVLGWLMTAVAISLGAPFWFDMLSKIMVIRSTVKPRETGQLEGAPERPPTGGGGDGGADRQVRGPEDSRKEKQADGTAGQPVKPPPIAGYEPEAWKDGFSNAGELL